MQLPSHLDDGPFRDHLVILHDAPFKPEEEYEVLFFRSFWNDLLVAAGGRKISSFNSFFLFF